MAKPTNEKELRNCLSGVERILSYAGLYGGNEITKARDLKARLTRLLSPEPAEPLVAEASEFISTFLPYIEANKRRSEGAEAAKEQASAESKARYAAHRAKQEAVITAERKRVEEMVARNNTKAAVAEVIG